MSQKKPIDPALQKRRIVSLLSLGVTIVFFIVITLTLGKRAILFVSDTESFRSWVQQNGLLGRIGLLGIMCLQVVISIIPGEVVEIAAGYAFGPWEGAVLCLLGASLGSCIIYGFTRKLGMRWVEAFVPIEKLSSLSFIHDAKKRDFWVFVLYLIPGTPKDMITYFIGLTPMRLGRFLLLSNIARVPSVISSTLGGGALGEKNYQLAIFVFAITTVVSILGLLVYRKIMARKNRQ